MGFSKFGKLLDGKKGEGISLQLTMSMIDKDTMSIMTAFRKGTEVLGVPLVVKGSFAEINAEYFGTVAGYQAKIEGFQTNMEALEAELKAKEEEAKKKVAEKGKKGAAPTKPAVKPVAAPSKESGPAKESNALNGQQGLFASLSSKANEGIAAEGDSGGGDNGGAEDDDADADPDGFVESVETEAEMEV